MREFCAGELGIETIDGMKSFLQQAQRLMDFRKKICVPTLERLELAAHPFKAGFCYAVFVRGIELAIDFFVNIDQLPERLWTTQTKTLLAHVHKWRREFPERWALSQLACALSPVTRACAQSWAAKARGGTNVDGLWPPTEPWREAVLGVVVDGRS